MTLSPVSSLRLRAVPWSLVSVLALSGAPAAQKSRAKSVPLRLIEVTNGSGLLLPHLVRVPDAHGLPTTQVIEIRAQADLRHLRSTNPILPTSAWPTQAVLPGGAGGNHFVLARFDQPLDLDSILSDRADAVGRANLTGAITVERVDPATGARRTVRGRAFVGGRTYGAADPGRPGRLFLEHWVEAGGANSLIAIDPRGEGFPGTQSSFPDAALLADSASFVFVPDVDDDLTTHEGFPLGAQIQVRLTTRVRARAGGALEDPGLASASVGPDNIPPALAVTSTGQLGITPGNGRTDVDPRTNVVLRFTEPIQLLTIGAMDDGTPPALSPTVLIQFGPPSGSVLVPFTVRPRSVFDLATIELDPVVDFPGSGPAMGPCPDFAAITVRVVESGIEDLRANTGTGEHTTTFHTAAGPGLVNAPVTPDTIYVARGGSAPGLSVIDLNGFGAGTGNPAYDLQHPILEGNSNFPNNPNVFLQGSSMIPPLAPGSCTFNGGSAGAFTLTKDSHLQDVLVGTPTLASFGDMALGHALDSVFHAGSPFGCQSGGGNLCATTGLKRASLIAGGPNTLVPSSLAPGSLPLKIVFGGENLVSWAPHPNPPPLVFPPLCQSPLIAGQEPTSVATTFPPPQGPGLNNLLVPGPFPLGIPSIGLPPQGTLALERNSFFEGPGAPQASIAQCPPFSMRQQIGQFLYVADRVAGEIVVLDSNHFRVLERVAVPDPTSLAMSPNLDWLAISSEATNRVDFLDIDPASTTYHQVVRSTPVGRGPRGLAWESGNEDILVCCTGDDSVYVISAFTLQVRKVLTSHLRSPIDVALTPRQVNFGFVRGTYFGYVLNGDGTVAVFESGPDGINGFGYDDILGELPFVFRSPKAIQPDVSNLFSAVFILHENPLDPGGIPTGQAGGALSRIGITGGTVGIVPLVQGEPPHFRNLEYGLLDSIGEGFSGLSGVPCDIAFDDQRNLSALTNFSTTFSAGQPLSINGKSQVKAISGGILPASRPQFLFLAVSDPGRIDVFTAEDLQRVDTNAFHPGIQSIPAPGVTGLMNYYRQ